MVEGRKTLPAMNLQRCSLPIQPSGSSDHSQVRVRPELQASNLRKPPTSPPTLSATSAERFNPGTGCQATGKAEDSGPSSQRFLQSHSSSGSETGISKVPPDVPPCFTCPSELQASNLRKPPTSPPTLSATSAERFNPGTGCQATGKAEDSGPSSQRFLQSHSSSGSETGISKVPPDVPPCFTCPSPSNQDCTRPLLTENRYSFPERPLRTASRRHLVILL